MIDIDSYSVNHGSPHKGADILQWTEKLPNHSLSGSFISRDIIKAKQRELDQKSQAWLFNPSHHAPIGSRYVDIYGDRVSDGWAETFKAALDL